MALARSVLDPLPRAYTAYGPGAYKGDALGTVGPFWNQQDCLGAAQRWEAAARMNRVLVIDERGNKCWYGESGNGR